MGRSTYYEFVREDGSHLRYEKDSRFMDIGELVSSGEGDFNVTKIEPHPRRDELFGTKVPGVGKIQGRAIFLVTVKPASLSTWRV